MFTIRIVDLEVFCRVGVSDEERAAPQRLMVTVEMETADEKASDTDDLSDTIDYFGVSQALREFGDGRSWRLLERLAGEMLGMIVARCRPKSVRVEIKKFVIPEARHVSVSCSRGRDEPGDAGDRRENTGGCR